MPVAALYLIGEASTALVLTARAVYLALRAPGPGTPTPAVIVGLVLACVTWPLTVPFFTLAKVAEVAGATWPARMRLWASSLDHSRRLACQFADLVQCPVKPWYPCTAPASRIVRTQGRVIGLCEQHGEFVSTPPRS